MVFASKERVPNRLQFYGNREGVMWWYKRESESGSTLIKTMQLRRATTFLNHEFIVIITRGGYTYRIDRNPLEEKFGDSKKGCRAIDTIEGVGSKDWETIQETSSCRVELTWGPGEPTIDLLLVLVICFVIHDRHQYTLEIYNCYFFSRTIIMIAVRKTGDWGAKCRLEKGAGWSDVALKRLGREQQFNQEEVQRALESVPDPYAAGRPEFWVKVVMERAGPAMERALERAKVAVALAKLSMVAPKAAIELANELMPEIKWVFLLAPLLFMRIWEVMRVAGAVVTMLVYFVVFTILWTRLLGPPEKQQEIYEAKMQAKMRAKGKLFEAAKPMAEELARKLTWSELKPVALLVLQMELPRILALGEPAMKESLEAVTNKLGRIAKFVDAQFFPSELLELKLGDEHVVTEYRQILSKLVVLPPLFSISLENDGKREPGKAHQELELFMVGLLAKQQKKAAILEYFFLSVEHRIQLETQEAMRSAWESVSEKFSGFYKMALHFNSLPSLK